MCSETKANRGRLAWALALAGGLLLALAPFCPLLAPAKAQQAPAPKPPARKAKKVWTNEDFQPRTAEKPASQTGKPEAAGQKAPGSPAPAAAKGPPPEVLEELQRIEDSARRIIEDLEPGRDALAAEIKALEEQRDAAGSPEEQAPIVAKTQEKQKELGPILQQILKARWQAREAQRKREELLKQFAPPPPPLEDSAVPAPGRTAAAEPEKKKEEPKPAPPK